MLRKIFAITLSGFMAFASLGMQVTAQSSANKEQIQKTRTKVIRLGIGPKARVEGKLRDDTRFKGHISAANQDSFTVVDAKTGVEQTVNYADVAQVKKRGGGFSTRNWIIVGAAVAATVIVSLTVIKPVLCDGC